MTVSEFDSNRLAHASSPYLRQHAGNPVHWQMWNAETLAHARATDTPILLSIGYSACHWCHVMAHECFENPTIAAAMNAAFVNIKLDREERPDIDRTYQLAHQALTGRGGGWPLTAFLDPHDLVPFFMGTYFPPAPRLGLPGFPEVLKQARAYFDTQRADLRARAAQLRDWLGRVLGQPSGTLPDADATQAAALRRFTARYDARHGGNQGAPKFPRPAELEWLLDLDSADGRAMAHTTIANMAARGLQDHLGGGFFRYCVDADWTIPHFEKMLYDNAALLPVLARAAASDAASADLRTRARGAARGIAEWLAHDMTAPDGAFYSSVDADSEHAEGKFYLWTQEAFAAALAGADTDLATAAFGLDRPPNFEHRAWHLLRDVPAAELAQRFADAQPSIAARLGAIRARLFDARARRVPPAHDDKRLTAWNALAIAGLARAARLLDDVASAALARRALGAVRTGAWVDGQLFANIEVPDRRIPGFLDDHAFLLEALLESLQVAFNPRDLAWATALADAMLDKFEDRDAGGFWFSTAAHATPLARVRDWTDAALPNGGGVAIHALLRLGHLLGETRYLDAAERALRAAGAALEQYPEACPTLLRALREFERPRPQVVVRGIGPQLGAWRPVLRAVARQDRADVFQIAAGARDLPGALAARTPRGDAGTAYVCSGITCQAPVTSPRELAGALDAAFASAGPSR